MAGDVRGVTVEEATTPAGAPSLDSATRWLDPSRPTWAAAAAVLALMVVVPLVWIFVASVHADQDNRLTLANYREAFTRAIYLQPIRHSLILASAVTVVAVASATGVTFAVGRSDVTSPWVVQMLVLAALCAADFLCWSYWAFLRAPISV